MTPPLKTLDNLGFARVDLARVKRRGFPEVIFGRGKSVPQIAAIADSLKAHRQTVLITKLTPEQANELATRSPWLTFFPESSMAAWKPAAGKPAAKKRWRVLVVTAGTGDIPVAQEACVTLGYLGEPVKKLFDVGVAGVHRLLQQKRTLAQARLIIVVAGMDGVLPSVVSGLVNSPVIAVPTSIGYGASFRGVGPLLTMLNSCSPGVAVVNIDNGFGAGYLAATILKKRV